MHISAYLARSSRTKSLASPETSFQALLAKSGSSVKMDFQICGHVLEVKQVPTVTRHGLLRPSVHKLSMRRGVAHLRERWVASVAPVIKGHEAAEELVSHHPSRPHVTGWIEL